MQKALLVYRSAVKLIEADLMEAKANGAKSEDELDIRMEFSSVGGAEQSSVITSGTKRNGTLGKEPALVQIV